MFDLVYFQVFLLCLLGAMSPGPSWVVIINNAIFKNRYHGILTSIGHGTGITVYATFAVFGIGLIIETNIFLFNTIKILSIIFLIYLGIKSIMSKDELDFKKQDMKSNFTSFFQGLGISILNPKVFIWFIAIYSQFVSIGNELIFNIYLIAIAGIVDASCYIILTLTVTSSTALNFFQTKNFILKKIIGFLFIFLGLSLLLKLIILN